MIYEKLLFEHSVFVCLIVCELRGFKTADSYV